MEPGGIEPNPNRHPSNQNAETDPTRATKRATGMVPDLAEIVQLWPTLSREVRSRVLQLCRLAATAPTGPADSKPTPIGNPVERSFGRQAIQCEHGGVDDRLPPGVVDPAGDGDRGFSRGDGDRGQTPGGVS